VTSNSLPNCDEIKPGFCEANRASIDHACHERGHQPGQLIFFQESGRTCYCVCGAGWTRPGLVLDAEGQPLPFALAQGEAVLAAGLALDFEPVLLGHVGMPPPRRFDNMVLIRYQADGFALSRVVHADTPLLTGDGDLLPASRLQRDDRLVSAEGEAIAIDQLTWGAFDGIVPEIATALAPPDDDLNGHLLVIDGAVTGDYAVQLFASPLIEPGRGGLMAVLRNRPSVGSREWDAANGGNGRGDAGEGALELEHGTFYSADFLTTMPPADAVSLLPEDVPLQRSADEVIPEDLDILDRARAALGPQAAEANLNLLIDWYANGEDALSWRDENGLRHLLIQGGLLRRDEAMALEAAERLFDRLH